MQKILILCAFLVAGCASKDGGGVCAQRKGTYVTKFTARTGNCGHVAESVNTIDTQPTAPIAPCTGSISYLSDNCTVTYSQTCPEDAIGPGYTSTQKGTADWNKDGTTGTGIIDLSVYDKSGQVVCHGTYDVSLSRQ